MRIMRFVDGQGQTHWGRPQGDGRAEILAGELWDRLTSTGRVVEVSRLLAPVQPVNIFCIGLNYRQHAQETGATIPEHPVLFMKPTTALNDPDAPIRIPRCCTHGPEVDYEVELAVVIGRRCRDVAPQEALQYVCGYTVANDVSARRWQKHNGGQWVRAKGFDTFCPLGPCLVTPGNDADSIADPQNLRLRTRLNGQVMQDSSTSDMIFPVCELVSFLSRDNTLLPGTVILTGTPSGVGVARKPAVFLKPGDEVVVEIDGIGRLRNPVVAG